MTKYSFVYIIMMPLFFIACGETKKQCDFCGSFNMLNLSKNNSNITVDKDVSIRRNLTINKDNGADFYTFWSWNEIKPDSGWSDNMLKIIQLKESELSIDKNGTWEWKIKTEEQYTTTAFFGIADYTANKEYHEQGNWTFLNDNPNQISLNITFQKSDIDIIVNEKNNPFKVIDEFLISEEISEFTEKKYRHFEIKKEKSNGGVTLKSIGENEIVNLEEIHNSSYSLFDGDILMTMQAHIPSRKITAQNKLCQVENRRITKK